MWREFVRLLRLTNPIDLWVPPRVGRWVPLRAVGGFFLPKCAQPRAIDVWMYRRSTWPQEPGGRFEEMRRWS
jgi:hypothetical protein